jgi:signal transduction histidine kinase
MFVLQAMAKGLDLQIVIAPSVPYSVLSDERRLKQVIINLISNALKFTDEGSIIIECDFNHQTKHIEFSVVDTGSGMRKSDQVKLFKMFGKLKSSHAQNQ